MSISCKIYKFNFLNVKGESKVRRPLRRRDPLAASASVGASVRNRLVRPANKIKSTTTTTTEAPPDTEPTETSAPVVTKITTTRRPNRRTSFRKNGLSTTSSPVVSKIAPSTNSINNSTAKDYKIVCYYTNWSQYRPKIGKYLPENIDPDLCTHIIFAFGWLKKGRLSSLEANDETVDGKVGLYEKVAALKKVNPSLKILLAIGQFL